MSKSIDEDIENTLFRLETLLEYSTSERADEILLLIKKAKTLWEEETETD